MAGKPHLNKQTCNYIHPEQGTVCHLVISIFSSSPDTMASMGGDTLSSENSSRLMFPNSLLRYGCTKPQDQHWNPDKHELQYLDSVEVFGVRENIQQFTVADKIQTREDESLGFQVILPTYLGRSKGNF